MIEIDKFELRRRRTRRCAFLLGGKLHDILGKMEGYTHKKAATGGGVQRKCGRTNAVVCFAPCTLHLTTTGDELLEALESVTNEPFNLEHRVAYIGLALQMQDGREMAADAGSDGKRSTSHRRQVIHVLGACQGPYNSHINV